jgi:hypothetical protein
MFTLAITHPHRSSVTTHPSREVALGELNQFLEATHHRLHVLTAEWMQASYEILGHGDRVVGHAAIDQICACTHAASDYAETSCTAITFDAGPFAECRCPGHRPVSTESHLFSPHPPS